MSLTSFYAHLACTWIAIIAIHVRLSILSRRADVATERMDILSKRIDLLGHVWIPEENYVS
jgi:hypothetical protein